MSEIFDFPLPSPLHRLNVHDNLTINADRWSFAHGYHRQRHSLQYQSLAQPGIVYGLGVKVIAPPAESRFKDSRWLEVQPGMAIDSQGNFIIVSAEHDRTYRLAVPAPQQTPITVYLIVKYVDPDGLELSEQRERVPEQFRLDETTQRPNPNLGEIELCRIHLALGEVQLQMPAQPMQPSTAQPNLLHRLPAKMRSLSYLRVALLTPQPNRTFQNFNWLTESLSALYPSLQCTVEPLNDFTALGQYGLVYVQPRQLSALGRLGREALQQYVAAGGNLLFEAAGDEQLSREAIAQLWPQKALQPINADHALKTQPFLFGQLPVVNEEEIKLLYCDGLLLLSERLSERWSVEDSQDVPVSREAIRAAHEFGINLLKFAWQRRQLYELLQ